MGDVDDAGYDGDVTMRMNGKDFWKTARIPSLIQVKTLTEHPQSN